MIPIQVKLNGFMSYRDEATLNFDGSPLWMLSGHNGAGKSTVFDAMKFALYGTHRRGSQLAEGLINHDASALRVEFDFQSGPDVYRVVRTLARGGSPTFQALHVKGPNTPRQGAASPTAIDETDRKVGLQRFIDTTIGLNEQTFGSAVMLQQGKSDALLSADAEDRHALLSQIVDLSAFERLEQRAEEGRKIAKARADMLTRHLASTNPVDEAYLESLRVKLDQLRAEVQEQRYRLETLLQLQPEAKRWEELSDEIKTLEAHVEAQNTLLKQAETIRRDFARFNELEMELPKLQKFAALQNQIMDLEKQAIALGAQQNVEIEMARQAIEEKLGHQQRQEELQTEIAQHETQRDEASTALLDALGKLPQQQNWFGLRAEIEQHNCDLANFAHDLDSQHRGAQEQLQEAEDTGRNFPFLREIFATREKWREAIKEQRQWQDYLSPIEAQLRQTESETELAEGRLGRAEANRSEAQNTKTKAVTLLEFAKKAVARFAEVEHKPTCHYCGQSLDDAHRAKEHARLQTALEDAQDQHRQASTSLENALAELEATKSAKQDIQEKSRVLRAQQQEADHALERVKHDLERMTQRASESIAELSPSWATKVCKDADETQGFPRELTGTFPDKTQLAALHEQVQLQPHLQQQVTYLAQQLQSQQRLQDQLEYAQRRFQKLDLLCQDYPPDLQQRHDEAKKALEEAKISIARIANQLNVLSRLVDESGAKAAQAEQRSGSIGLQLAQKKGVSESLQSQIQNLRQTLSPGLAAESLDKALLAELENEKSRLVDQEITTQQQKLDTIENQHKTLLQNLEHLANAKSKIRLEAQVPISHLVVEEEELRASLTASESQITVSESECSALKNAKNQRDVWQKEFQEADKSARLHKNVAEKLGRDWLQRQMLQEAEIAIIDGANDVLDRISSSELRLELRDDNTPEVAGTRRGAARALDFVVYNSQLGQPPRPMHPAFLSGSQRFRVAVSLALGIGHYTSHGKGRVESVIIDEGFGSLDKQGRQEMIDELRELKSVLKRVILVSHQEEFSDAFANRYHIEVVEGTSRVSLLETNIE